ncbi:MAG: hypothetical protein ACTSR2_10415 [Candidatus Hodarchaeales archaeon]
MVKKLESYYDGLEIILDKFHTLASRHLAVFELNVFFTLINPDYELEANPFHIKSKRSNETIISLSGPLEFMLDYQLSLIRRLFLIQDKESSEMAFSQVLDDVLPSIPDDIPAVSIIDYLIFLFPLVLSEKIDDLLWQNILKRYSKIPKKEHSKFTLKIIKAMILRGSMQGGITPSLDLKFRYILQKYKHSKDLDYFIIELCKLLLIGWDISPKNRNTDLIPWVQKLASYIQQQPYKQQYQLIIQRSLPALADIETNCSIKSLDTLTATSNNVELLIEAALYFWYSDDQTSAEFCQRKLLQWLKDAFTISEKLRNDAFNRGAPKRKNEVGTIDYGDTYDVFSKNIELVTQIGISLAQCCIVTQKKDIIRDIEETIKGKTCEVYLLHILQEVAKSWAHLNHNKAAFKTLQHMLMILENEMAITAHLLLHPKNEDLKRLEPTFKRLIYNIRFIIETAAILFSFSSDKKICTAIEPIYDSEILSFFSPDIFPLSFYESVSLLFIRVLTREVFQRETHLDWMFFYGIWEQYPLADLSELVGSIASSMRKKKLFRGVRGIKGLKEPNSMIERLMNPKTKLKKPKRRLTVHNKKTVRKRKPSLSKKTSSKSISTKKKPRRRR